MKKWVHKLQVRYLLPYCVEQIPSWEANRLSASQEIRRILWNPKAHYCIHKRYLSVSWAISLQSLLLHPNSLRSILISSSHLPLGLPSSLFPSGLPTKTSPLPPTCYIPRPSHSSGFDHPNSIWWVQIIKLHNMQSAPLHCYLVYLRPIL